MSEEVILYSTGCPKCAVLKKKLEMNRIPFTINRDVDEMERLGMLSAPALYVDGELLDFSAAIRWADSQKE